MRIADLQRLSIEGGGKPSEVDRQAMENARSRFYTAQYEYESANETITTLNDERHQLKQSIAGIDAELRQFKNKSQAEYNDARRSHDLKIASLKLAFVVPLLLLAAWQVKKKRGSIYQPFNWAALVATFWMVWLVMWDHFPRDFSSMSPSSRRSASYEHFSPGRSAHRRAHARPHCSSAIAKRTKTIAAPRATSRFCAERSNRRSGASAAPNFTERRLAKRSRPATLARPAAKHSSINAATAAR